MAEVSTGICGNMFGSGSGIFSPGQLNGRMTKTDHSDVRKVSKNELGEEDGLRRESAHERADSAMASGADFKLFSANHLPFMSRMANQCSR